MGSFAADILITASMLYIVSSWFNVVAGALLVKLYTNRTQHLYGVAQLNKAKTTAFNDSNSILDRLIKQTVETSAVTVVCAGVELMLFLLYPLNDDHVAP